MSKSEMRGIRPGLKVMISAGAAGIGRAMAETFTDRGCKVHVCDIDDAALAAIQAERPDIGAFKADVADEAAIEAWFEEAQAWLGGGLDVLVNNAGIAGPTAPIEEMDSDEWRRTIDINLNSHFYCLKRAVPLLKQSDDASIINMSSVAGRLGMRFRTPYSATKYGIVGMTETLARELGPAGIRVNAIQPGVVDGDRIRRVLNARAETRGASYDEMEAEALGKVSLRRMVSEQDIAEMAAFLCTPMGANITGQSLSVCAGVEDT